MQTYEDIVGQQHVRRDATSCRYFGNDIFFWPDAAQAIAVIAPATAQQVAAVVSAAAAAGHAIVTRGGGMSYSGGYVPARSDSVILDLRRLCRVRQLDVENQFVTVEAGATWAQLSEALAPTGLRPIFRPPYSGIYSTIGGALSQGTADEMSGVLSLEVVTARAEILQTGSASRNDCASPFFRNFGPDLTGLFIADGGTLAVKTAASLALEPLPPAKGYVSFAFESFEALMRAAASCCRLRLPGRIMGLDPRKSQNAPRVGFKAAIETLARTALSQPSVSAGLRDALGMAAAGRNFMEGVQWSLHLTAEGVSERAVEDAVALYRAIAMRDGREIPNLLPMALAAQPYSVRGFLGPDGERWVPTNAMIPLGDAEAAATLVQQFFASHRRRMQQHDLWESYMIGPRHGFIVLEPSFYWRDEVSALHLDHLDAVSARRFAARETNPQARELALELRAGLITALENFGAAHVQLAKAYRYRSRLTPGARTLFDALKRALDPDGRLNPGNLGR